MRRTRKRYAREVGIYLKGTSPFQAPFYKHMQKHRVTPRTRAHFSFRGDVCRWLRRRSSGESQKSDLNERKWPLALRHGVGVWEQPEQRPLWLIGLIWQQGKKRSLKGPSGYSFHHLTCLIWTHSYSHQRSFYSCSFTLRFTFPLSHFNDRLSSSNEATVEPSEVTWLSKMSLSISQMYMKMPLPGVLGWPCS